MKAVVVIEFDLPNDQITLNQTFFNSGKMIGYINPAPKQVHIAINYDAERVIDIFRRG